MRGRHPAHCLARAEVGAEHVGAKNVEYVALVHCVDPEHGQHAGVVHQHVELAERGVEPREHALDLTQLPDVGLQRDRCSACAFDVRDHSMRGSLAAQVIHADPVAAASRQQRNLGADSAAGTGHQHHFGHGRFTPPGCWLRGPAGST
jgi:hypothetical protein